MKRIFIAMIFLFCSYFGSAQESKLIELQARKGLPAFFNKIDKADSITIAYFGGSITEAAGYRVQTEALFRRTYPGIRLRTINAAIGGTGSDLGVFRLRDDVLNYKPDLVFVEYAVNDFGTDTSVIENSIEGIVRQIKKANPGTDICFVYTLSKPMLRDLTHGKMVRSARVMERIANHYSLPSINFAAPVIDMLLRDALVFDTTATTDAKGRVIFSKDAVHPLPAGHQIYTDAVERSFASMRLLKRKKPGRLVSPLYASNFESALYLSPSSFFQTEGWKKGVPGFLPKWFTKAFPDLIYTDNINDSIVIHFKGRLLGFADIIGPTSSAASISVDGGPAFRVQRFDQFCGNHRRHYYLLKPLPEGNHIVVVKLDASPFDKIKIVKPDELGDINKYRDNNLYIGKVMMVGTPIP